MSRILLDPSSLHDARLVPPLSKSDAQRALVLAYARGEPDAVALPSGEELPHDVRALRQGLATLSALGDREETIDCGDGGAPFRFLLTQACLVPGARVRFVGSPRLGERPHQPLVDALHAALGPLGLKLTAGDPWPLLVEAPAHPLAVARFLSTGRESSQFASSLLLGCARVVAQTGKPCRLDLDGPIASTGYLELTLDWLQRMGFTVLSDDRSHAVTARAPSLAQRAEVPGDWSSLGYLLLLSWASGSHVARVDLSAKHPDRAVAWNLEALGLTLRSPVSGLMVVEGKPLGGLDVTAKECPDSVLTLGALACVLHAPSTFRDVSVLKVKESDRVAGLHALVTAAGGTVETLEQGEVLRVHPPAQVAPLVLESRGDHRLAMSAAVLSVLGRAPLELEGPECVAKSFPGFWRQLENLGCTVKPAPPGSVYGRRAKA
jgi:3-phosphoshikimate 1-carboxyvinyltransferase